MLIENLLAGASKKIWLYSQWRVITRHVLLIIVVVMTVVNVGWFFINTTAYERYLWLESIAARYALSMQSFKNEKGPTLINFETPDGKTHQISAASYLDSRLYYALIKKFTKTILWGFYLSISVTLLLLFMSIFCYIRRGQKIKEKHYMSGAKLVPVKYFNHLLCHRKKQSPLPIGNSYYVKGTEIEHTLVLGATRQGKSTFIKQLCQATLPLGHKRVIFDLDGTYSALFYRPDRDYLLNCRDARSQAWNIWSECADDIDIHSIAQSLIPLGKQQAIDRFWVSAAQIIFSSVAAGLMSRGQCQTRELLHYLFSIKRNDIASLLRGTEAEVLVAEHLEKMTGSIKAVLSTHIRCLRYLDDESEKPLFSIKRWMNDDKNSDSTLFVSVRERDFDTFRPLISMWLDIAVSSALTLSEDRQRRVWFLYDEIATLQHLPSLEKGITKGGKRGVCFVLGGQSLGQFEQNYNPATTKTLFDNCSTKIYFRTPGADTAKWVSADMGEEEFAQELPGRSLSSGRRGGSTTSASEQQKTRPVVSYTDIKNLSPLNAFLNVAGNWPITKIKFTIPPSQVKAPAFIPSDIKPMRAERITASSEDGSLKHGVTSKTVESTTNDSFDVQQNPKSKNMEWWM